MTTSTAAAFPAGGADRDDGWLRPSPRLRAMRTAQVAVMTALVALVAGVLTGLAVDGLAAALATAAAVAAGLIVAWFVLRRVRAWSYLERHDDLLVRRGVFITRLSVVPYGRMQFVDVAAGPIERLFGLATVHMHTAAAASDARIPGLERADAARLRDQLAALGEAKAAGL
jgi:membrane protein YdbS with pleckstrin-like domain